MAASWRLRSFIGSAILASALLACSTDAGSPDRARQTYFEGTEIADELADDPTARFFVDLRDDEVFTFDQEDRPIDFAHFAVQCPSMPRPLPMPDFAALLGMTLDDPYWTLRSSAAGFRQTGTDCVRQCFPNGTCIEICIEDAIE